MDLFASVRVQHHSRTVQGLDGTATFTVRLVASHAIGGVNLFSALQDLRQCPNFGWVVHFGGHFLLLYSNPSRVVFSTQDFDVDGHISVLFTAQLLALTVIVTNSFSAEPSVTHKTRNGVLLDTQRRHSKGMNHVIGCCDDANLFVDRHNQGVVDL